MVPDSVRPARWKESKEVAGEVRDGRKHPPAFLSLEKVPTDPCHSTTHFKINKVSLSCVTQSFTNCCLCAGPWNEHNLGLLQPFGPPRCKSHWFTKSSITEPPLPSVDPPGWSLDLLLFRG